MENFRKGWLAAAAATLILSVLILVQTMMGMMPQLDTIGALGDALGSGRIMGRFVHLVVGILIYGTAIAVLAPQRTRGAMRDGLFLSVAGWLIMSILLMPLAGLSTFGLEAGVMAPPVLLMLHLIFGAVLGWTYGKLAGSD